VIWEEIGKVQTNLIKMIEVSQVGREEEVLN